MPEFAKFLPDTQPTGAVVFAAHVLNTFSGGAFQDSMVKVDTAAFQHMAVMRAAQAAGAEQEQDHPYNAVEIDAML